MLIEIMFVISLLLMMAILNQYRLILRKLDALFKFDHCPVSRDCRYGSPVLSECLKDVYDEMDGDH